MENGKKLIWIFLVKTVEKTEKETLLEAELKKVEDEYKATRQKVNDLRHMSDKELWILVHTKIVSHTS